jgi:uncharacterized membrane protein YkoI
MKEIVDKLEKSPEFKKWRETHKEEYLASMFLISSKEKLSVNWQVDYYNLKKNQMTSFVVHDESVEQLPPEEVFKRAEDVVDELDISKVKISYEDAIINANAILKDKYRNEDVNKQILILQQLDRLVWNITYVTALFNMLNVRVDAITGEVISENFSSLMNFKI